MAEVIGRGILTWFCPVCTAMTLLSRAEHGECCQEPHRADCPIRVPRTVPLRPYDPPFRAADFRRVHDALDAAEDEEELLRAMSGDNWRAAIAGLKFAAEVRDYHDPSFPPRVCDRPGCGRWYTGPAVYCSIHCAVGDA